MKQLTRDECIKMQLEIMDKIDDFCTKHTLRYSLGGGTLLGAVRHQGFSPWDDDIDIMMPRPDYEIFLEKFQGTYDHLNINDHSTNPEYVSAFAKVIDNRSFAIGRNNIDDRGVFVDVFPIDGLPEKNDDSLREEILTLMDNLRKAGRYYKFANSFTEKSLLFLKYCIKRLTTPNLNNIFHSLQAIIDRYPFDECEDAGCLVSQYGYFRERQKKTVFLNYRDIMFEDRTYRCINDYHSYLTSLYGDYMVLPPEDQRVGAHFTKVFIK